MSHYRPSKRGLNFGHKWKVDISVPKTLSTESEVNIHQLFLWLHSKPPLKGTLRNIHTYTDTGFCPGLPHHASVAGLTRLGRTVWWCLHTSGATSRKLGRVCLRGPRTRKRVGVPGFLLTCGRNKGERASFCFQNPEKGTEPEMLKEGAEADAGIPGSPNLRAGLRPLKFDSISLL